MTHSTNQLKSFIEHARSKNMDHQTIRMLLLSAGWKERDIAVAIGEGLEQPVPVPIDAGGARDAFFHLLTFAGLYAIVVSSLVLLYTFINLWFPDAALEQYVNMDSIRESIRLSLAALIVATPIFFWMTRLVLGEMKKNPEKESSQIRRWLTYLTLFIASTILMGDLVSVIYRLLDGEISIRFLLKALSMGVVTGMVFTYYFRSLKSSLVEQEKLHKRFAIVTVSAIVLIIAYGFYVAGSPGAQRERKIDDQRVEDIRQIADAIYDYVYDGNRFVYDVVVPPKKSVPEDLNTFAEENTRFRLRLSDPEEKPYEYEVSSSTTFKLCTNFAEADTQVNYMAPFWDHPAGGHCYEFDTSRRDLP